jgi:subtilisin family serine protease
VSALPSGRRPVVATIDTGIGTHPWLPVGVLATDPVVEVSTDFQTLLADHEAAVALASGDTVEPLTSPFEERDLIQPLLGLTDSHSGHGTFIGGLVHQSCPDARILSLRVLHTDGIAAEGSVLLALEWLRERVQTAIDNAQHDMLVDVVTLSLGFYPEQGDESDRQQLADAITRLTDLGVVVVAAAGNDATTRPFFPAALGLDPAHPDGGNALVLAIGALNASGATTAAFSNDGGWISRWAPGNSVVSTVPLWQGSAEGGLSLPDHAGSGPRLRSAPDADDLTTGFAVWAGTSFAAPIVAGILGAALAEAPDATGIPARVARAVQAVATADVELGNRGWL